MGLKVLLDLPHQQYDVQPRAVVLEGLVEHDISDLSHGRALGRYIYQAEHVVLVLEPCTKCLGDMHWVAFYVDDALAV